MRNGLELVLLAVGASACATIVAVQMMSAGFITEDGLGPITTLMTSLW